MTKLVWTVKFSPRFYLGGIVKYVFFKVVGQMFRDMKKLVEKDMKENAKE